MTKKTKKPPNKFPNLKSEGDLNSLRGFIICEKPNTRLYEFKGRIIMKNNEQ
jgi:hypothetical protein